MAAVDLTQDDDAPKAPRSASPASSAGSSRRSAAASSSGGGSRARAAERDAEETLCIAKPNARYFYS